MKITSLITPGLYLAWAAAAMAQTAPSTAPAPPNAADDYLLAFRSIPAVSPSASNFDFPGYPPYGPDWDRLSQDAWDKDAKARELAHRARSIDTVVWPTKLRYLNDCRNLANTLADAAVYQHLHDDDAGAASTIEDLLHFTKLLRAGRPSTLIQHLVAGGIDAMTSDRMMVIASNVRLTDDPSDVKNLQLAVARRVIGELLDQRDAPAVVHEMPAEFAKLTKLTHDRLFEAIQRINAERTFTAMSLACHLYLFDNHHWPDALQDFIPRYLPNAPIDPWGDGKQTYGYALIVAGLPDGADRPLVYCRCELKGNLSYRVDEPQYGFYNTDGSNKPIADQHRGGQFRDVASWVPGQRPPNAPTSKVLE